MEWYLNVLKNYTGFQGRARRLEYWMFMLFNFIASVIMDIIDRIVHITPFLAVIYALVVFLPSLAVTVRRLHDIGKSGWWVLIGIIPFIGEIILIVFACLDSQPFENQYGPNPKI